MAELTQPSTRALRRRGVMGKVTIFLQGNVLTFAGEKGGELRVTPANVERLRVGIEEGENGQIHCARLWLAGDDGRFGIRAHGSDAAVYVPMMRAFGAAMVATGKLSCLERGTTKAGAVAMIVLFGLLTLTMLGISIFTLTDEAWYVRFMPMLMPVVLVALGRVLWRRNLPAPVASLEEFNAAVDGTRR